MLELAKNAQIYLLQRLDCNLNASFLIVLNLINSRFCQNEDERKIGNFAQKLCKCLQKATPATSEAEKNEKGPL